MTIDVLALANAAAATGPNHTEATKGGGDGGSYVPPAGGIAMARLVGYIEIGDHSKVFKKGQPPEVKPQTRLIFELMGPRHEPKKLEDGTVLPYRITEDINASKNYGPLNEKAGLYKLFKRMNYDGTATHFSQLLGKPYLITLSHRKVGEGPTARTYVDIRDDGGYRIAPPRQTNVLDGTITEIQVPPAVSQLRLFLWNAGPDVIGKMWDTLFIEGSYPERKNDKGEVTAPAKSKNVLQETVLKALNFKGSPLDEYLQTNGQALTLGAAGNSQAGQAATGGSAPVAGATAPAATASAPVAEPAKVVGQADPLAAM